MKKIDTKLLGSIYFAAGIAFILIAIIAVVFSICFKKNYLFDIIQSGTIGVLLVFSSYRFKRQINSVVARCLFILFIVASIMKYCF